MSLSEFHAVTPAATGAQESSSLVRINWADEMEKLDDGSNRKRLFVTCLLAQVLTIEFTDW